MNEADRLAALRRHNILDTPADRRFDRIVALVRSVCRVPIALVSLVDADRQWFKAKSGVDVNETARTTSVCAIAIRHPGLFQIDDLAADPRTAAMSLVTDAPHIRFYAGVSLISADGHALGTLCAIDTVPRPGGLDDDQIGALALLAEQVVELIANQDAIDARNQALALDHAARRVRETEERYHAIVDSAIDNAIIAIDADGIVTSWSVGAERIFGWRAEQMIGSHADRFFTPEDRQQGIAEREFVDARTHGRASDTRWHMRKDGSRFFAHGAMTPLKGADRPGFVKAVRDITEEHATRVALEEAHRSARMMTSAARLGTFDYDLVGGSLHWDDGCRALFGLPPGAPVGYAEAFLRGVHPDDREQADAAVAAALDPDGSGRFETEYRTIGIEDGVLRHVAARGQALFEDGTARRLIGTVQDVTEARVAEGERDEAADRLSRSEAKWRSVFETLQEGFILGEVVRDGDGRVVDWRYVEVNDAWYDLVGVERGCALGRTIREVFPGIEDEWVLEFADVVDRDETIRFTRQVGDLSRWYDGVAQRAGDEQFTVIFTEVTDRVLRERRQTAVLRLSDRLREEATAAGIAAVAGEVLGEALDAQLVGYGDVDPAAETITVERDWTTGGAATLAGTLHFRDFGSYVDDLTAGRTVIVRDCRSDPRTRDHAAALEARSARAFVNTPVFERGIFVALLYVSSVEPRDWSDEELLFIRDVAYRVRLEIDRLRAVEQQEVLNAELSHRIKNTLSVVQAIAMQTLAGKADDASVEEFGSRLKALSSAHDVLLTRSWSAAALRDVADAALMSFAGDRIALSGPDVRIGSRAAMSLSLLLHELATNAGKYGALSVPTGRVDLSWVVRPGERGELLEMRWAERGGPPAVEPTRRGFGSRIIRMGLIGSGGVHLSYAKEGLTVEMSALLAQAQQS